MEMISFGSTKGRNVSSIKPMASQRFRLKLKMQSSFDIEQQMIKII